MADSKNEDTSLSAHISPIEEIIEEIRNGKMIILVDAEDRENEGDLVIPAQMATPDVINFMATNGRGLICLPITEQRAEELQLPYMVQHNKARNATPFTVSIEAREGISTGISAHDRAHTVAVAIDPTKSHADIVSPGHIFPLVARNGGVLVRAGHTEASVDLARLAGLNPAGVICEIMNDDGTMARMPDLVPYAKKHNLKLGTIADLIAYRRKYDNLVKVVHQSEVSSAFGGDFTLKIYASTIDQVEHIALVKGDIRSGGPVPVRMHAANVLNDVLGLNGATRSDIQKAMNRIGELGRGVVVLINDDEPGALSRRLDPEQAPGKEGASPRLVEYGMGAQILLDLGVQEMELLTNSPLPNIVGLDGYGLKITGTQKLDQG